MQWQELWDQDLSQLRNENLDIEKSTMAVLLTPRSSRMEYGIELTRRLLQKIEQLVTSNHGQLVIFRTQKPSDQIDFEKNVFLLNGKYYRASQKQRETTTEDVNRGFQAYTIPIRLQDWRAGPRDGHLNEHAVDQVMEDLAARLNNVIPRL